MEGEHLIFGNRIKPYRFNNQYLNYKWYDPLVLSSFSVVIDVIFCLNNNIRDVDEIKNWMDRWRSEYYLSKDAIQIIIDYIEGKRE